MASGWFDPEIRPPSWFDTELNLDGWWDRDLLPESTVPTSFPPRFNSMAHMLVR